MTPAHLILLIILLLRESYVNCNPFRKIEVDTLSNATEVIQKWKAMQSNFENTIQNLLKLALPFLLRAGSQVDMSDECYDSLTKVAFGLGRYKLWAVKMVDSMGKPTSGMMSGSFSSLGAYDQCLSIEVNPNEYGGFKGQYCALTIRPPLPAKTPFYRTDTVLRDLQNFTTKNEVFQELKGNAALFYTLGFRLGLCVPSLCSQDDVQKVVNGVVSGMEMYGKVTDCHTKESVIFETDQIIIICLLLAFVLITVLATVAHLIGFEKAKDINGTKSLCWQLIRSFSIPYNVTNIFKTDFHQDQKELLCLHGLKVISMSWVVLGHTYCFNNKQILNDLLYVVDFGQDIWFQTILNALLSVDTFFFVSGVILCNVTVKLVNKYGTRAFIVPIFVGRRVWRLIPAALLTVGLLILTPLTGSGPFWHENMDSEVHYCRKNWWAIALSINNFVDVEEMCMAHTWYISVEMQLFLCSMVFLWLLFRKPIYGFFMAAVMIMVSIVVPAALTYFLNLPPTFLIVNPDIEDLKTWQNNYYLKPYGHAGPYAIGLLVGYLLAIRVSIPIPRFIRCVGWVLAFGICGSIVYSPVIWHQQSRTPTVLEAVAFASLYRIGWTLGVAYVTIMCARGYGGFVNSILSCKAMLPFSRITYLVYLLHYVVMWYQVSTNRSTVDSRHSFTVWIMFGHLWGTVLLAFLVKIFFDSPLKEIESVFLGRLISKKIEPKITDNKELTSQTNTKL